MLDVGGDVGFYVRPRFSVGTFGLIDVQSPYEEYRRAQPRGGVIQRIGV